MTRKAFEEMQRRLQLLHGILRVQLRYINMIFDLFIILNFAFLACCTKDSTGTIQIPGKNMGQFATVAATGNSLGIESGKEKRYNLIPHLLFDVDIAHAMYMSTE